MSTTKISLQEFVFKHYREPIAKVIAARISPELRSVLVSIGQDEEKLVAALVQSSPFGGFVSRSVYGDLAPEVLNHLRTLQKTEEEDQRARETSAEELKQMGRVLKAEREIKDAAQRAVFSAWYRGLSLPARSYFHKIVSKIGDDVLVEMVKSDLSALEVMLEGIDRPPGKVDEIARRIAQLKEAVRARPEISAKVDVYLKRIGSEQAQNFWRLAEETFGADADRLAFLVELPPEQIDAYLGMKPEGFLSRLQRSVKEFSETVFGKK